MTLSQPLVIGLATAAATIVVGWLALRGHIINARTMTTTDLINQLQDERTEAKKEHERQLAEIKAEHEKQRGELQQIVADAQADRRVLMDYIEVLRQHISDAKTPPPPVWPEGLRT